MSESDVGGGGPRGRPPQELTVESELPPIETALEAAVYAEDPPTAEVFRALLAEYRHHIEADLAAQLADLRGDRDHLKAEAFDKHCGMMEAMAERDALQQQLEHVGYSFLDRYIPKETQQYLAADGDDLGETLVKLLGEFDRLRGVEAELARLRSRGRALQQQLEETATWLEGFDEPIMATAVEIELVRDAHVMAKRLREACADALTASMKDDER